MFHLQYAYCQTLSEASSSLVEKEESRRWHQSMQNQTNATVFAARQSRHLQFEGMFENVAAKG